MGQIPRYFADHLNHARPRPCSLAIALEVASTLVADKALMQIRVGLPRSRDRCDASEIKKRERRFDVRVVRT